MAKGLDQNGVVLLTNDIKTLADATYPANISIAPNYDATSAYAIGDYCIYSGMLYKCNTTIATGGEAWTAAHWTQVSVANEFGENIHTITLPASGWVSTDSTEKYWKVGNPYYQVVTIPNTVTTSCTKVDLQPNTQILTHLDLVRATGIYTENHNGAISVYVNGGKPTENLSIQCTAIETNKENPVGNYVGMPTSSDEYHNFIDIDGAINSTNWTSYHTAIHFKNGWGMIVINGATKVAMSANTHYKIVNLPSYLIEKIGATEQIGFAFAGSVPCMAELDTWDEGVDAIRLYPKAAVAKGTGVQGTIIFAIT